MQKNHTCKILAIGIIVLFIGIGIHPAFALRDKASSESYIDSNNADGEIYQNANCFVMGSAHGTGKWPSKGLRISPFLNGDITFGESMVASGSVLRANGWIYTLGKSVKWKYEGKFIGSNGVHTYWITNEEFECYIGVKGFRGIAILELLFNPCIFVGYADSVKISPA